MSRLAAALLPIALLAVACGREADTDGTQRVALELVVAAKPTSFDPAQAGRVGNLILQRQILETLVEYDPDRAPDGIQGLLADRWSVDAQGLVWTFHLRDGARFHDPAATPLWPGGEREVVAADVVHSWQRLRDPAIGADTGWATEIIDSLRAVDDRTVEIRLVHRDENFLRRIAVQSFAIVPADLEGEGARSYRDTPVGSAPYALEEWTPGLSAIFRRIADAPTVNPAGRTVARIPELRFHYVEDATLRTELFERGASARYSPAQDAHARMLPDGQLATELAERFISLHHAEIPDVTLLVFQMEDPTVGVIPGDTEGNRQRLLLRRALAASFPRAGWTTLVRPNNSATAAQNFLPPMLDGWAEAPAFPWHGGPGQAADLLAEAGWPNGVGAPPIRFDAPNAKPIERAITDLLVASWRKLGLTVSSSPHADFDSLQEAAGRGETMIMLRTWVLDWPDPALLFDVFDGALIDGSTNQSRFRDPEFDRLLVEFRTAEAEQRNELSSQLIAILNEQVPAAPIDHRGGVLLVQPWLEDFQLHPFDPYACKFWALAEVAD